jgi:phosphoglycolate phosphatase/pyrophosphatase PpaX
LNNTLKHICFDLDGTIIDSNLTIYRSTLATLRSLNINIEIDADEFRGRIGHHFTDIFEAMNIPVTDFEEFIKVYKKKYFDFISDSVVFEGVPEILEYLMQKGILISLLTTKAQDQADRIIEHFGLKKYFSIVMGRRDGIPHKPSPVPLFLICKSLQVNPGETLMLGDTELDIECGKNANAKTCAIMHGYRTLEELERLYPDFIIESMSELRNIIEKESGSSCGMKFNQ